MTTAEIVLIEDLRRALSLAVAQFAESVTTGAFEHAERWASISFGLIEAIEEPASA